MTEEKGKLMTEQLRLTNSDEDVADYIRWIVKSDVAKKYWTEKEPLSPSLPNDKQMNILIEQAYILGLKHNHNNLPTPRVEFRNFLRQSFLTNATVDKADLHLQIQSYQQREERLTAYLNEIKERMIRRFQSEFPSDKWDMISGVIESHFEKIARVEEEGGENG